MQIKKTLDYIIIALAVLLAFSLLFKPYLELPGLLQWMGRWHPLLLHFPIVLVLLAALQSWMKPERQIPFLLPVTTLLSLLTALAGLFLSLEQEGQGQLLNWHQWSGASLAFLLTLWYALEENQWGPKWASRLLPIGAALLVFPTGHTGGSITHGEDFLALPGKEEPAGNLPDNPTIFTHLVMPILEEKCVKCHNPNKSKGELLLASYEDMLKGGKNGPAIVMDNLGESPLLQRMALPLAEEEHMPPEGQAQLSSSEVALIEAWVRSGASPEIRLNDTPVDSSLAQLASRFVARRQAQAWQQLPEVQDATLEKLNTDYAVVRRIAAGTQALSVRLFKHPDFSVEDINRLRPVAGNIVELDLSGLPLEEEHLRKVSRFEALEKLTLSQSTVTDEALASLEGLEKLHTFRGSRTLLSAQALPTLLSWPQLKRLYLWNTEFPAEALRELQQARPQLEIIKQLEVEFTSTLIKPEILEPRSFFTEPYYLHLEYPIPGVGVYYTLDGSTPDSSSAVWKDSLLIERSGMLKFIAIKEGWEDSPLDSLLIMETLPAPDSFALQFPPDPSYDGLGALSLFDRAKAGTDFRDTLWLGYRETGLILEAHWKEPVLLDSVLLSTLLNPAPYIFPPKSIEVFGASQPGQWEKLGSLRPEMPGRQVPPQLQYHLIRLKAKPIRHLKIHAVPVRSLPAWHPGKGSPGWIFIDELVLR